MKRGEIYYIKPTHNEVGNEQHAGRPAVIVSNDKNNEFSGTVEIVYMTMSPKKDMPTHVITRSTLEPSTLLCEQITTVSKARIGTMFGKLTDSEMQVVDNALAISLGLDFGAAQKKTEPTDDEVKRLIAQLRTEPLQIHIPETDLSSELIKAETERDIYKHLYNELLDHMKGLTNE